MKTVEYLKETKTSGTLEHDVSWTMLNKLAFHVARLTDLAGVFLPTRLLSTSNNALNCPMTLKNLWLAASCSPVNSRLSIRFMSASPSTKAEISCKITALDIKRDLLKHEFVKLDNIKEALNLYSVQDHLENNELGLFLLSLCNRDCIGGSPSVRITLAEKIFNASNHKTVELYNSLLQVYVKNHHAVTKEKVLKDMKNLNIKPDQVTYSSLIALCCICGDLEGANEVNKMMNQLEIEIPFEVYGYLSYGLCIAGKHADAMYIIDSLIKKDINMSWKEATWLCKGLARTNHTDLLHDSMKEFSSVIQSKLSITQLLDIAEELFQIGNVNECENIVQYIKDLSEKDIVYSIERMKQFNASSFLVKLLSKTEDSCSQNLTIFAGLLDNAIANQDNIKKLWQVTQDLKQCFPHFRHIEHYVLNSLQKTNSRNWKPFFDKYLENGYVLMPHLSFTNHNVSQYKNTVNFKPYRFRQWNKMQNFNETDNVGQSQYVSELDVNSTSEELVAHMENCSDGELAKYLQDTMLQVVQLSSSFPIDIYVSALTTLMNNKGRENDILSPIIFRSLMSVFEKCFEEDNLEKPCEMLEMLIEEDFHILPSTMKTIYRDVEPEVQCLVNMKFSSRDEPFKQSFFKNKCRYLLAVYHVRKQDIEKIKDDIKDLTELHKGGAKVFLSSFLLDVLYHLSPDKCEVVLKEITNLLHELPQSFLTVLFYYYVKTNNVEEARFLMNNYQIIRDLNIISFPVSVIKCCNPDMLQFLTECHHFTDDLGKAIWSVYCSLLKAGQFDHVAEILPKIKNMKLSPDHFQALVNSLGTTADLSEKYEYILDHCNHLQKPSEAVMKKGVIKYFIKTGNLEKAVDLIEQLPEEQRKFNGLLFSAYIAQNLIPPSPTVKMSKDIRNLIELIYREENTNKKWSRDVVSEMKKLVQKGKRIEFNWLCAFFSRLPLQEYEPTKRALENIMVGFKPERQSAILIDRILHFIQKNLLQEGFTFAKAHLDDINSENEFVWKFVITALSHAAMKMQKNDLFVQLYNFAPNSEMRCIVKSYINLHLIMVRNNFDFPKTSLPEMNNLVRVLISTEDLDTFDKICRIFLTKKSRQRNSVINFLTAVVANDSLPGTVDDLFTKFDPSSIAMTSVASKSYSLANNYNDLITIDTTLRRQKSYDMDWNMHLNKCLYRQFIHLLGSNDLSFSILSYLIDCYHLIPCCFNSRSVTNIYLNVYLFLMFDDTKNGQISLWKTMKRSQQSKVTLLKGPHVENIVKFAQ
ncbi:unnamed protein product [Clavelina lepadiformis]|uniref:Leucine-rich PPR motif-containing protein, mitochondrial n=1 Tax=Clavelina lepadiformis TaxID=159417 RepID=A0ABP0FY10_CLALP